VSQCTYQAGNSVADGTVRVRQTLPPLPGSAPGVAVGLFAVLRTGLAIRAQIVGSRAVDTANRARLVVVDEFALYPNSGTEPLASPPKKSHEVVPSPAGRFGERVRLWPLHGKGGVPGLETSADHEIRENQDDPLSVSLDHGLMEGSSRAPSPSITRPSRSSS
jgi:hypothetical protein